VSSVLLDNTRKLNRILQASGSNGVVFSDVTEVLSQILDCNVFISSSKGRILGMSVPKEKSTQTFTITDTKDCHMSYDYNQELLKYEDTQLNINTGDNKDVEITIVPIYSGNGRLGTLIFELFGKRMTTEDIILAEYSATVVGLEITRSKAEEMEENARKKAVVQLAIDTLSYSEMEAVGHIFKELDGMEGLLVASKIADRAGITRSVIVNALRKLESAGVIESRSLGMKGTHIKILNEELLTELENVK
jgi:transcriptional pleiotropic repressor